VVEQVLEGELAVLAREGGALEGVTVVVNCGASVVMR
jgi:hypothetical protein